VGEGKLKTDTKALLIAEIVFNRSSLVFSFEFFRKEPLQVLGVDS
jgi:hypothetical protein